MLENLPKIRLWQIVLILIIVSAVFIGDWIDLLLHSLNSKEKDTFVASTAELILKYEVPAEGTARTEIEQRFGPGREAIPGTGEKNLPTDVTYPLGAGTELRVSYDKAGISKTCGLFYFNQGIYEQALPTSTSDDTYFALTDLVRLQLFLLLLHPYAVIGIMSLLCLYIIALTPPVQRFINRNKKDEPPPAWLQPYIDPNPSKAEKP
jgi:hypothetical protein